MIPMEFKIAIISISMFLVGTQLEGRLAGVNIKVIAGWAGIAAIVFAGIGLIRL